MMHFQDLTPGTIRPQKRHLKCSGWLEVELNSEEDELLGVKKGPNRGVPILSLPKVSLLCQRCPLLIYIHGCGICSWHGACSWSTHQCRCANLKIQFWLFGENNIQLLQCIGFSTLANKKTSATFKTSLFFFLFAVETNETKE
jgi:hypothetical protein